MQENKGDLHQLVFERKLVIYFGGLDLAWQLRVHSFKAWL